MPERPPAMQGELWAEAPRRAPLTFAVGEALDGGVKALRKSGVVLTLAQVIASLPGAAVSVGLGYGLGEPHFATRAYWERLLLEAGIGLFLGALFHAGLVRMALDASRGQKPSLRALAGGMRLFPAMLAFDVAQVVVLAVSIPLLFLPYAFGWTGVMLAPIALVDRDLDLAESLRWSWRLTRGERLHLFGFLVATAVVSYLGIVACCVGTFPAAALTSVATAFVYLRLGGEDMRIAPAQAEVAT